MSRSNFQRRTYTAASEGIIEVFVDASNMPITVQPHNSDTLVIDYYASPDYPYEAYNDGGIIILNCPQPRAQGGLGGLIGSILSGMGSHAWNDLPISIYVPRSFTGMLNLSTAHARISVSNIELRDRMHAATRNAAIELRGVIASAFDISTTNARIIAENAAACGLPGEDGKPQPMDNVIASTNGAVHLSSFSTLGALSLQTTNSGIALSDVAVLGPLTCRSTNGSIKLDNVSVQDVVLARTTNSGISLSRLLAHDIELATSNGSIRGSIQGRYEDFDVDCGTTNGRCNLASSAARTGRFLRAHSTNASISIVFEE